MPQDIDSGDRGGIAAGGKAFPLVEDTFRVYDGFSGRLSVLRPAMEVRRLLSYNDTLWIATDGGLFCYSTFQDTIVEVKGNFAASIRAIAVNDDGWLYVGDESGLSVRKGGRWIRYSSRSNRFFSRLRDVVCTDGEVWLATFGNGCGLIDGDTLRAYTLEDSLLDNRVNRILVENPYSIFFGSESGLCRADTSRWESYRYGKRIPVGAIRDMAFDEGGNLFLAVAGHGIVLYDLMRVKQFGIEDGLPSLEINAFSLDSDGNLWAGGDRGICYFDGSGWVPFESGDYSFRQHRILSLEHDVEGSLFAGTDDGKVIAVSMGSVRVIEIPRKFPGKRVSSIRRSGDSVWFVADGRLYYAKDGALGAVKLPADWFEGSVMDVLPLKAGRELWVATRFGVLHLADGSWQLFDRRQGLPTDFFTSVVEDSSGNIWFSTFDAALLELAKDRWVHHTEDSGLPGNDVTDMEVDSEGTLWVVVSGRQLARYTGKRWEKVEIAEEELAEGYMRTATDTSITSIPGVRVLENETNPNAGNKLTLGLGNLGHLLVATPGAIYRYFASGWQAMTYPERFKGISPTDVYATAGGEVFLGTCDDGLIVYSNGGWIRLNTAAGLSDDHVLCTVGDPWGNVIAGTQTGGLIKISSPSN